MKNEKLSREAWVAAGFLSLAEAGPASLKINLLAKRVGATKGSFYWHFKDLKTYKEAMLELWISKVATEVFDEVKMAETKDAKIDILLSNAARPAPEEYGGRKIEPAMRAWSLSDPDVSQALSNLDLLRITFTAEVLKALGIEDEALVHLVYAAYIGLDDLSSKGKADIGLSLNALKKLILSQIES